MSISPLITFKAGLCDVDTNVSPPVVKAKTTPGYLYLFEEDDLIHFCWRPRSASMSSPEVDLVMVPTDGRFVPFKDFEKSTDTVTKSPTNGRIFVLKFQSSTQRHFFWLQAKSQHPQGDPAWFSPRDLKMGDIVDRLLQGDEVNPQEEISNLQNEGGGNDGDDATMEDVSPEELGDSRGNQGSGGDSSESRNNPSNTGPAGGAGGNQAAAAPSVDAATAVQNFLRSMQGSQALQGSQAQAQGKIFTTLPDLLSTSTTIPVIASASSELVDTLLSHIPPTLVLLGQQADIDSSSADPNSETLRAALEALSLDQKKEILRKVLRSPQFAQSLNSLTGALREGGLPSISDALKIPVENGGFVKGGTVPLGGGEAVEAFVNGVAASAKEQNDASEGRMEVE